MVKAIFTYSGSEDIYPELFARSGQEVEVLKAYTKKEIDIEDVGPMYQIKFQDGLVHDAFADELKNI